MHKKVYGTEEPPLLARVREHGFKTFTGSANFDLNIVGLRNPHNVANKFDDKIFVIHKENGHWVEYIFACTTDPGQYHLNNPGRVEGTAIMVHPQQCRGVYKIDLHGGKYEALCQRNGKVSVWRDNNKDQILDREGNHHQGYGINIHRASAYSTTQNVERYSAGCTVIANPEDFDVFLNLCKKQVSVNGWEKFTYTLLLGTVGDFE